MQTGAKGKPPKATTGKPRKKDRGADLFVEALKAQGVKQIVGLTGGAIMEAMDAMYSDEDIQVHFAQTEGGATWAAIGYARTTGEVGVCAVTSGPGATNTVTAIADAHRDNVPLVVITGQVPTSARNTDAFQETNITKIAAPTAKRVFYLHRAEDIPKTVAEAFRIAHEGRPGPVLIDFTKDAQQEGVSPEAFKSIEQYIPCLQEDTLPEEELDEVVRLVGQAKRPVIIVGYGAVLAGVQKELQQLLQIAPCPVVHTLPGKAALPTDHPLNFGMLGMHGFYVCNWMVHYADLVISFGARYDDRITGNTEKFAPGAGKLVHFDISRQQIQKVLPERKLGVPGNLKHTLPALIHRLQDTHLDFRSWHEEIAEIQVKFPSTYKRKLDILQTQFFVETLNRVMRRNVERTGRRVAYATEVGDHQMWCGQFLFLQDGWKFMTSSGQGAMGAGLPMSIGAQLADPDLLVVCVAGDGSLRMSEADLETIAEYGLPIKIFVINNAGYGIVRMWNHLFYEGRETGVVKPKKRWTLLAEACGFGKQAIHRVESPAELEATIDAVLDAEGPQFVELITPYEECLPLMPPGKCFTDTVL
ncbi:MAG TPA: thiamine pyrophosphate-binding protein [Acidobacteriota bacterium]|nr:thiamine pyrophosphate-binding protein [Acidobacteriota bacterium]HRR55388.1 thiamine pyrophosphate-binding protein [Acidobacteriota bacterium]HRV07121.1 thiamine pyrophosphate-binding protein [Acidobacteriota bacterium]